jgi:hypothetical protein
VKHSWYGGGDDDGDYDNGLNCAVGDDEGKVGHDDGDDDSNGDGGGGNDNVNGSNVDGGG